MLLWRLTKIFSVLFLLEKTRRAGMVPRRLPPVLRSTGAAPKSQGKIDRRSTVGTRRRSWSKVPGASAELAVINKLIAQARIKLETLYFFLSSRFLTGHRRHGLSKPI